MGPASIESHYDEALAVPGVLDEIAKGERDGVDGYVLACFGDPGLDAARELASGPVVAIAEAGMKVATYLGRGFTVVTTLGRTIGRAWDLAAHYGVKDPAATSGPARSRCWTWRSPGRRPATVITAECATGGRRGRCDVIVLGLRRDGRPGRRHQSADRGAGGRRGCRGHHDGAVVGGDGPDDQHPVANTPPPRPKDVRGLLSDFALT